MIGSQQNTKNHRNGSFDDYDGDDYDVNNIENNKIANENISNDEVLEENSDFVDDKGGGLSVVNNDGSNDNFSLFDGEFKSGDFDLTHSHQQQYLFGERLAKASKNDDYQRGDGYSSDIKRVSIPFEENQETSMRRSQKRQSVIEAMANARRSALSSSERSSGTPSSCFGNDGIHSAFIFLATSADTTLLKKIAAFSASWIVVIWQLFLYGFIVGESTKPYCLVDDDCREGQVCRADSFCGIPQETMVPVGTDDDPIFANNNYKNHATGGSINQIPQAQEDCPFLNQCTTWGTRLSCIFVLVFIVGSVIDDMDQNSRAFRAGTHRLDSLKHQQTSNNHSCCTKRHHAFVALNIWALYYVRAYLIPYTVFCATIAIIYAEDGTISAQKVILNGLAVSFIGSFDDALFGLLVPPKLQDESGMHMALANVYYIRQHYNQGQRQENRIWIFHRIMCATYVALCSWIIFQPIDAIKKSPGIFATSMSYRQEYASCDDFYSAIGVWPSILLVAFASLDKVVMQASFRIIMRDCLLGPIFLLIFWGVVFLAMLSIYTSSTCMA